MIRRLETWLLGSVTRQTASLAGELEALHAGSRPPRWRKVADELPCKFNAEPQPAEPFFNCFPRNCAEAVSTAASHVCNNVPAPCRPFPMKDLTI
jgi:hypothetical protein